MVKLIVTPIIPTKQSEQKQKWNTISLYGESHQYEGNYIKSVNLLVLCNKSQFKKKKKTFFFPLFSFLLGWGDTIHNLLTVQCQAKNYLTPQESTCFGRCSSPSSEISSLSFLATLLDTRSSSLIGILSSLM